MKIWLDSTPEQHTSNRECDCPVYDQPADVDLLANEEDLSSISTDTFQQISLLYIQRYRHENWIVCHPAGSGQIAVLDTTGVFLLKQFQTPTTVFQVVQTISCWSFEAVKKAVAIFLKLGFLQNLTSPFPVKQWHSPQTLTAWMHVTNACNLRCPYCYLSKTSEHMNDDIARRAVDAVFRSTIKHNFKSVRLHYAGGEASLHMTHVAAIHNYADQLAQRYNVTMNGILLSNGVALSQRSIDTLKAHSIGVMLSLDGLGAYHDSQRLFINGQGSFQYVHRTIGRMLTSGLVPHISITVSRRNLNGISDLIKYVLEREMPFSINYYRENEHSIHVHDLRFQEAEMITTMYKAFDVIKEHLPRRSMLDCLIDRASMYKPHQRTCGVGHSYLVIDQKGGVAKCHADIMNRVATIDVDDPLQMIKNDQNGVQGHIVDNKEGCKVCDWRYWCTGGCPLLTYKVTGRYDVKSPNCNIYKALFPEVLRLEAARLLQYELPITL